MNEAVKGLCASLPQGEAEVWLRNGEITFSVKWATDEAAATDIGNGFYFLLNGQNEEVKVAELAADVIPSQKPTETQDHENNLHPKIETDGNNPKNRKTELKKTEEEVRPSRQSKILKQLITFLQLHYTFRYNRMTDLTECAALPVEKDTSKKLSTGELVDNKQHTHRYQPVNNRLLNSISLAVLQAGIPCWDRDVKPTWIQQTSPPTIPLPITWNASRNGTGWTASRPSPNALAVSRFG